MPDSYSPLTVVLSELLECGFGVPASAELLGRLEAVVGGHGLGGDKAPTWVFEFFSRLLTRRITPRTERYEIPSGYPLGECGLSNILLDIDRDIYPLGFDDYGEDAAWPIPGLGIRVSIIREWNGGGCGVVIAPLRA